MNTPLRHTRAFSLPYGATVTFSWRPDGLDRVIDPKPPAHLSARRQRRFLRAYQEARARFLRDVATMLGGTVVVADTEGAVDVIEPETRQ
ncbi:MAG: hypothetical protein EOQ69_21655 [Mesorhizobium sp.]|nr:MAG: hypothetical protein EOQ69_21655 [Mesorhizobium sp.]